MIKQKEHFHGSDLEKIEQIYHIKKEDITSFSANVNPLGVSYQLRKSLSEHIDAITTYPDRDYVSLRSSISDYIHAPLENIMVGNGSTELISIFIKLIKAKHALMLGPTYSEYERELTLSGSSFSYFYLKEENEFALPIDELEKELVNNVDLLILCNPNNPTSTVLTTTKLREILTLCKKNNIYVLIDETYIEFTEDISLYSAVPLTEEFDNLVVLRGISKFFAAPGLRLGYAVCGNQELLKCVNENKNPWTINTLASIAGEIMFSDVEYMEQTKTLISTERKRICDILKKSPDLHVFEPSANFVLVKICKPGITAFDLFEACIRKGLMIRDCSTFQGLSESYFRFCFMSPEKNDELVHTILEHLSTN